MEMKQQKFANITSSLVGVSRPSVVISFMLNKQEEVEEWLVVLQVVLQVEGVEM